MILGQYRFKVGAKNRIALPKKFRDVLGEELVITCGFEKSLIVADKNVWETLLTEEERSFLSPEARDITRFLLGGATEIELDEQGRFILPKYLAEFAGITHEVVYLGVATHVEIWDALVWEDYKSLMELQMRETARRLGEKTRK